MPGHLEKALKDKNPDTRKQAADRASFVGSTEPYPSELEALLDDEDVKSGFRRSPACRISRTAEPFPRSTRP